MRSFHWHRQRWAIKRTIATWQWQDAFMTAWFQSCAGNSCLFSTCLHAYMLNYYYLHADAIIFTFIQKLTLKHGERSSRCTWGQWKTVQSCDSTCVTQVGPRSRRSAEATVDKLGPDPSDLVGEVSCFPLPSSGNHQEEQWAASTHTHTCTHTVLFSFPHFHRLENRATSLHSWVQFEPPSSPNHHHHRLKQQASQVLQTCHHLE